MPFGTGLPPENLDPWYTSMSASWAAMTSFVNGLETAVGLRVLTSTYTAAMALKADLVAGLIPTSQLPPLAINEVFTPANQTARLLLTAQRGDMAIQVDNGVTYVLASDSPSTNADWKVVSAAGAVNSVAGKTGTVSLVKADVGLGSVDNTSDASKPVSTAMQTALNLKVTLPADPNADRILFWDDSTGTVTWLSLGTGLQIDATTLNATGGGATGTTVYYNAVADTWASRPASSTPVMWISTTDATAAQPAGMVAGDMWIRHPDALEAL